MTAVVPNSAERGVLEHLLGLGLSLRLFTNDITPGPFDIGPDYDEASGFGYPIGGIALPEGEWTVLAGMPSRATHARVSFELGRGTMPLYGYYLLTAAGELIGAERFADGPYRMSQGGEIRVTPELRCGGLAGD